MIILELTLDMSLELRVNQWSDEALQRFRRSTHRQAGLVVHRRPIKVDRQPREPQLPGAQIAQILTPAFPVIGHTLSLWSLLGQRDG